MERIEEVELKEFHRMLITLACQTWTISCIVQRIPFGTSKLQDIVESSQTRLRRISQVLLIEQSVLEAESYTPAEYNLARNKLAEVFPLFTQVHELCHTLRNYKGTAGTDRKYEPSDLMEGGGTSMEISPLNECISEFLLGVATECEDRVLDILSQFKCLTEIISALYPLFSSSHSQSIRSGLVEGPRLPHTLEHPFPILREKPQFIAKEDDIGTDSIKVIAAEYWNWYIEDHSRQLRVPSIVTLHLRDITKPGFETIAENLHTSRDLHQIIRLLIHLALARRRKPLFENIFGELETAAAGLLLLRDQARVSIRHGRIKEKNIFLFENCLVFARQKSLEQAIVCRVSLSDLLEVRYQPGDAEKEGGILTVYWQEHQLELEEISGARMFFDDVDVLKIWAAFLAINAYKEPAAGSFSFQPTRPWLEDTSLLPRIARIREVLSLLPVIKSGALDPDDSYSVLYHLRGLVMDS